MCIHAYVCIYICTKRYLICKYIHVYVSTKKNYNYPSIKMYACICVYIYILFIYLFIVCILSVMKRIFGSLTPSFDICLLYLEVTVICIFLNKYLKYTYVHIHAFK